MVVNYNAAVSSIVWEKTEEPNKVKLSNSSTYIYQNKLHNIMMLLHET